MIHPDIAPAMSAGIFLQFVRRSIADEIERLISILDQIDGDADLEDSDSDADLAGYLYGDDTRYGDLEDDMSDGEPALGWTHGGQKGDAKQFGPQFWGDSYGDDREGDEADCEPDNEDSDEYNLPPFEMVQQEAPRITNRAAAIKRRAMV